MGSITKQMGIKPGSSEFMDLKNGSSDKLNKMKDNMGKPKKKK